MAEKQTHSTLRRPDYEAALGRWVVRRRWFIITTSLVVVLLAAAGTRHLTFNNDTRAFFSEDNPQLAALEDLERTYDKDNSIFFVLAPRVGDVFTRDTLNAIETLTEQAWSLPYSERVNSIANYQHTWSDGDELMVEDLITGAKDLSQDEIARARSVALSEPLLVNRLISPSGHVTAVSVNLILPDESLEEVPTAAAAANQMADELRNEHPELVVYLAGSVMSDAAFGEASRRDMATLIPLMFLTFVVVIGVSLRSVYGTLGTLSVVLIASLTAMGLAGWLRISITSASAVAPTIILTLAIADSVHILATMFGKLRQGIAQREAIASSVGTNIRPVFLTSATTTIGFLTMNFSDAPPFRDLGNIVAMGVVAAFVYSVLFLPAFMAILPLRVKPRSTAPKPRLASIVDFIIAKPATILWSGSALMLATMAGITQAELYDDFMKYFSDRYEIRRASDFIENNLSGTHSIHYSLESGEAGGVHDPAYLAKVEEFENWYREQPKVVHVSAITTVMKRLNKNMHEDDEAFLRIPERRDLAAQYLLLYEMSLPAGLDLNNELNSDRSASRMIVTLAHTNTKELRAMDAQARAWLKRNAPESMFTYGSGLSIIWAHISERNINSMLGASFGALALISLLLIIALRSWKLGLLSLIPNLAPALMAFGLWGLAVGRVGLGHSIIVAMTLGIVVDDSIHFLAKYLRARREQAMDAPAAIRYSFRTVGMAMGITTLSLVAGFGVLAFSGYKMNADMGLMAALTITLAFAMDMVFLPALLMKVPNAGAAIVWPHWWSTAWCKHRCLWRHCAPNLRKEAHRGEMVSDE